jgi:hypothetical protein
MDKDSEPTKAKEKKNKKSARKGSESETKSSPKKRKKTAGESSRSPSKPAAKRNKKSNKIADEETHDTGNVLARMDDADFGTNEEMDTELRNLKEILKDRTLSVGFEVDPQIVTILMTTFSLAERIQMATQRIMCEGKSVPLSSLGVETQSQSSSSGTFYVAASSMPSSSSAVSSTLFSQTAPTTITFTSTIGPASGTPDTRLHVAFYLDSSIV